MFLVNTQKCAGCGICAEACPHGAIHVIGGRAQIEPALCVGCGVCAHVCPQGAIQSAVPVGWRIYSPSQAAPSGLGQQLRDLRARTEALEEELHRLMERFRRLEGVRSRG